MSEVLDYRRIPDRRRQPRGGRRPGDRKGFAPLVLLVGADHGVMDGAEAILARLRFAVSTSPSVDAAASVITSLRPDIIVASEDGAARLRTELPQHLPVVVMDAEMAGNPDALVDEVRRTLHRPIAI